MSKQMRAKLTPWIAALALLALVALTAVPGFAASPTNKLYTIDVTGPLGTTGNTSFAPGPATRHSR